MPNDVKKVSTLLPVQLAEEIENTCAEDSEFSWARFLRERCRDYIRHKKIMEARGGRPGLESALARLANQK